MSRYFSFGLVAAAAALVTGCGHAASQQYTAGHEAAQKRAALAIAQQCPELVQARAGHESAFERVFIEAADLTHATLGAPTGTWLRENVLELEKAQVGGTLAENNNEAVLPWTVCHDGIDCAQASAGSEFAWTLRFTPHLPAEASGIIKLSDLSIRGPDQNQSLIQGLNIATHDQRPIVVQLPISGTGAAKALVALTPYLISSDAELIILQQCRMRAHRRLLDAATGERPSAG